MKQCEERKEKKMCCKPITTDVPSRVLVTVTPGFPALSTKSIENAAIPSFSLLATVICVE